MCTWFSEESYDIHLSDTQGFHYSIDMTVGINGYTLGLLFCITFRDCDVERGSLL